MLLAGHRPQTGQRWHVHTWPSSLTGHIRPDTLLSATFEIIFQRREIVLSHLE